MSVPEIAASATVGVLHPGEMGAAMGAAFRRAGHRVIWASQGRGESTRARAADAGLEDVQSVERLAAESGIVLSVVPPHAAEDVAVAVAGRARLLVDANAVSPRTSLRLRALVESAGTSFVDGAVIGLPPARTRPTTLFVSGPEADEVRTALAVASVDVLTLEGPAAASALKMCYAAWTKGSQALLLATLATARALGVERDLREEWDRTQPGLTTRAEHVGMEATRKGWRWTNEMLQISDTFSAVAIPGTFHQAAAEIFTRSPRDPLAEAGPETLDAVLRALTTPSAEEDGDSLG